MKKNIFLTDLISMISSNLLILISGIISSIIIPKIMFVQQYGYFKYFSLYITYASLLHFGFVDGILLKFAGKGSDSLDQKKFRMYTKFFFIFQCFIACIIIVVSSIFLTGFLKKIMILVAADMVAINLTTYFQFISQAIMNFKQLSIRNTLQYTLKIIILCVIIALKKYNYIHSVTAEIYIALLVLIDYFLFIWYSISYKKLIFGEKETFNKNKSEIWYYFVSGIPLTLSYQLANIVSSLDRQFVAVFFSVKEYAVYSFTYSLLTLINPLTNAISTVLLPNLRKKEFKSSIANEFEKNIGVVQILSCCAMIAYYPLNSFVNFFLPKYSESITFLKILFPSLIVISCINIVIFTYYKAINKVSKYFKMCLNVLIVTLALNFFAIIFLKNVYVIAIVSEIVTLFWYFESEYFFIKNYQVKHVRNDIYMLVMSIIFYASVFLTTGFLTMIIYTSLFIVITMYMYKVEFINCINKFF